MSSDSNPDLIDQIIGEYLDRKQKKESPTIEEYCQKHPGHADEIRSLLNIVDRVDADLPVESGSINNQFDTELDDQSGSTRETPALRQLAGYRIIREIGRGGMGIVYEAEHEGLKRRAALKVLPKPMSSDARPVLRFLREGRSIAKMHHSNIVPLYEVGEEGGRFFLAMQLIQGKSLDLIIKSAMKFDKGSTPQDDAALLYQKVFLNSSNRPAPWKYKFSSSSSSGSAAHRYFCKVAQIGIQAAEALAYAHGRGVIHRDLKPSNLVLDESGVIWLTDFGLAKIEGDDLTQSGDFVGTLRYMSPERFQNVCDERSDVYGLGLTLYELLTLRSVFESSDRLGTIRKISHEELPRPRAINRQIPRDLETIVVKAIEKDPLARYTSAQELAEDLRCFVDDLPIQARRVSVFERLIRWSRRNHKVAAALALAIASLFLLAAVSSYSAVTNAHLRTEAEEANGELKKRGLQLKTQSRQLMQNLYFAQMNLASEAIARPYGSDTAKAQLTRWSPDQDGTDFVGWEWHFLDAYTHQEQFVSEPQSDWTWEVDFSPDGCQLLNTINSWGFQIRDAKTGTLLQSKEIGSCRSSQYSPDGKSIATSDFRGDIYIWDAITLEQKMAIRCETDFEVSAVRWSPNSRQIASCSLPTQCVHIWDATSGRIEKKLPFPEPSQTSHRVEWSPNGHYLALVTNHPTIYIWNVKTGEEMTRLNNVGLKRAFCWSPDSKQIVTGGPLRVWDIQTGQLVVEGPDSAESSIAWRPGFNQVLSCGKRGMFLWDLQTLQTVHTFYGHTDQVRSISWSPDGSRFASSGLDQTVRVWNVGDNSPHQRFLFPGQHLQSMDWDASGLYLVASSSRNLINVLNTQTGLIDIRQTTEGLDGFRINSVAQSARSDSRLDKLAAGGQAKQIHVLDLAADKSVELDGSIGEITQLDWSFSGKLAAICWSPHYDPKVELNSQKRHSYLVIWNESGTLVSRPKRSHDTLGKHLAWHPNKSLIATTAGGQIRIWNGDTLEIVHEWHTKFQLAEVCWSPNGERLAIAARNATLIWDAKTGRQVAKLDEILENFRSVTWSPNGKQLAVGSSNSLTIWNVSCGRVAIKFPFGSECVRWSPDGRRIATCRGNLLQVLDAGPGCE